MHAAAVFTRPPTSFFRCARVALAGICLAATGVMAGAQTPQAQAATAAPQATTQAPAQNTAAEQKNAQQKPAPVTTTVVVRGEVEDNYLPESVTVGTLDGATLKNTPLSATVITRDLLTDQVSRLLSDVVKNDASVGDDYVPVGYYGVYQIRGFPLDLATGLEINGLTIAGEQDVPLENKQSVEFLKGIAGVESGVASAGGLIDYVTKRPANVQAIDLATDHRGTAYGAIDLGHLFGSRKQVGARMNLGAERIVTYMNDANGWRAVGAAAADWKIDAKTTLKGDFEYQHKNERDGSGYQLLGGTTVPDIDRIYRSTMLGDQPWGPADTYDTFNSSVRIDRALSPSWLVYAAAGLSHSLIQDNVIYVYGTPLDANGNADCPGAPDAPSYFFCPDGSYGTYDYRNPDELRINAQAEAMVSGHIRTGPMTHDVTAGGVLFLRNVEMPSEAVYAYIGGENIYKPITPLSIEDPIESAGPRALDLDSRQSAGLIQDRVHLPGRVEVIAAGRYDSLRDHNFSAGNNTDKPVWLPQFAVTFSPTDTLTLYSNYAVLLSLGPQGPWWVDNSSEYLSPFYTRQAEIGAKYEPGQRILLTAALYRMRAPFFYPKVLQAPDSVCTYNFSWDTDFAPGDLCFESEGRETHDGLELNASGKAANWLRLNASAAALSAKSDNTGTPDFDNRQVINVPRAHTNVFADLTVPGFAGLHVMPGWSYTSRKEATRDDTVSVPSYNLFSLGARYTPGGEQGRVTFRIYSDNITNKHYWSDTGASYGDTFLWLGAPATVRLSAHYVF